MYATMFNALSFSSNVIIYRVLAIYSKTVEMKYETSTTLNELIIVLTLFFECCIDRMRR